MKNFNEVIEALKSGQDVDLSGIPPSPPTTPLPAADNTGSMRSGTVDGQAVGGQAVGGQAVGGQAVGGQAVGGQAPGTNAGTDMKSPTETLADGEGI